MSVLQGLVSNSGKLYAAWKSGPGDDRIFYSSWDGTGKWEAAGLTGGTTSVGPALGVYNGSVYAAWKGQWSDPRIFFSKLNSSKWDAAQQIPNIYSDTGPALCSFGGKLVAAWKSVFDQHMYFATFDGSRWSGQTLIAGVESSFGPSLANFSGKLYAAWQGKNLNKSIWYATYDGSPWSAETQIAGFGTSVGPSLATVGGKLYAVWKSESDESLWYASFDGTKWSAQAQIPAGISSIGAAIAEFNGKLYAMARGKDSDSSLHLADLGTQWSGWTTDIPGNFGPDVTTLLPVPAGSANNYALADSKGAAVTGTAVTIIVAEDIVTQNSKAYSFQINCNSPAQKLGAAPFVWQQYGFRIARNQLFFWVNCFRLQDEPGSPLVNWDSRVLKSSGNYAVVSLTNNRLPAGWQLTTTLTTNPGNKVTGFAWSIIKPDGTVLQSPTQTLQGINSSITSSNLASILNFQVIMVAENIPDDGPADSVKFSAGRGIFQCHADTDLVAIGTQTESGESSNVS